MRPLPDPEEQATGRAAARADLALAGQLDMRSVLDAGRYRHLDGAPGADPAVPVAFRARMGDHRAVAAAPWTGPRRHHLAEEGPGDLAHLAAPAAHLTRVRVRTRRRALTRAGGADNRGVDDKLPGRAERTLGQVKLDPQGGIAASSGPPARPACARSRPEERVHDVAERKSRGEPARPGRARWRELVGAEIVHLALIGVGQHLVRLGDLLEAFLSLRVRVHVRMQLTRQSAVRLLDLVLAGVAANAERGVVVGRHYEPARICLT